jgi:hypothetical protein
VVHQIYAKGRRVAEMLGKILVFKEYIKVADKARIEMM